MRTLSIILLSLTLLTACSAPNAPECQEYEFIQFVSYIDTQAYRFEQDNKQYFFFSDEPLDLELGEKYTVCLEDDLIISIH